MLKPGNRNQQMQVTAPPPRGAILLRKRSTAGQRKQRQRIADSRILTEPVIPVIKRSDGATMPLVTTEPVKATQKRSGARVPQTAASTEWTKIMRGRLAKPDTKPVTDETEASSQGSGELGPKRKQPRKRRGRQSQRTTFAAMVAGLANE